MKAAWHARFTYEDVRIALSEKYNIEIMGVKLAEGSGYIVETCGKKQQPNEPSEEQDEPGSLVKDGQVA